MPGFTAVVDSQAVWNHTLKHSLKAEYPIHCRMQTKIAYPSEAHSNFQLFKPYPKDNLNCVFDYNSISPTPNLFYSTA